MAQHIQNALLTGDATPYGNIILVSGQGRIKGGYPDILAITKEQLICKYKEKGYESAGNNSDHRG